MHFKSISELYAAGGAGTWNYIWLHICSLDYYEL